MCGAFAVPMEATQDKGRATITINLAQGTSWTQICMTRVVTNATAELGHNVTSITASLVQPSQKR